MGRTGIGILLVCVLVLFYGCQRPAEIETADSPSKIETTQVPSLAEADLDSLDKILQNALPSLGGGAALLLIEKDRTVYRKTFGSFRAEQVLPIASATKWLSGAVILSLVDEGLLALDNTLVQYLPEFTDQKASISVRQLFAHTSGLPPEAACRNNRATSLEECVKTMARLSLQADPGTRFHYGGVSMHVGGRVAEVVTGKPWNEIFMERIAMPLGLTQTDYHAYGPTQNPRPAGDARSTLDEYGKFLLMLLNRGSFQGTRVLSEEAVDQMHRDQTEGASISYSIFGDKGHLDSSLPASRYGVGVWLESGEAVSSPGALGAYPWIDLRNNVAGLILTRSTFSPSLPVYLRIKQEYQDILAKESLRED